MDHFWYIAYKEGVVWNLTRDLETVEDWFNRKVIDGYEAFVYVGVEKWHEDSEDNDV